MAHKLVRGTLSSAVADAGTFTASYPARVSPNYGTTDAGDFYEGRQHKLVMNGSVLVSPDDFTLSFGASNITVTNRSGATWPTESDFILQLDEPGKRVYFDDGTQQAVAGVTRSDVFLVSLGAPDVADANGICASQSIAAGTATTATSATLDGALASGGAVTLDVPRNVVASWTTTSVLAVEGYDVYGKFMVEKSASGTTLTGKKAFKRISRVWSTVAITSATVGTGDVLGLPMFLPNARNVLAEIVDGEVAGSKERVALALQINSTDLLAGTAQYIPSPVAGRVARITTAVQATFGATAAELGQVHVTAGGSAITGSTITTFATDDAVGDSVSAEIPSTAANAAVSVGDAIGVVPGSTWASAGALNVVIEIAPTGSSQYLNGTFVTGDQTAGGATATTGDVRGTYAPPATPDGSIVFQLLMSLPDPGYLGPDQWVE